MAKASEVLTMLCKNVEWVLRGETYEDIDWLDNEPAITKKQFTDGFVKYDAWKAEQDAAQAATKSALLERLGITEDEAKLLLS